MKKIIFLTIVFLAPSIALAATLSVSPSSQNVNTGDTFSISVNLNTQGTSIDGVDLRYLNYDSNLLQIQDANTSLSGIQISPGSLMSMTLANNVDTSLGRITFSQVASGGNKYSGSGILATITFKAVAAGTAGITFNYSSGNTTDSNVAAAGVDVLSAVVNGSYAINNASSGSSSSSSGGGGGGSSSGNSSGSSGGTSGNSSGTTGSLVTNSYTTAYTFSRNLSRGSEGGDVTALQNFLISKNYLSPDNATGFFGPLTESALKRFQSAQGIVSSGSPATTGYGNFGPGTRAKVSALMGTGTVQTANMSIQQMITLIQELQKQVNGLMLKLQQMQR